MSKELMTIVYYIGCVLAPIGFLMFATWLTAMIKMRTGKTGKFQVKRGSLSYWLARVGCMTATFYINFFESGPFCFNPIESWKDTHHEFVTHECRSLCGLFWRILFLLIILPITLSVFVIVFIASVPLILLWFVLVFVWRGIVKIIEIALDSFSFGKKAEDQPEAPNGNFNTESSTEEMLPHVLYTTLCYIKNYGYAKAMQIVQEQMDLAQRGSIEAIIYWSHKDVVWRRSRWIPLSRLLQKAHEQKGDNYSTWVESPEFKVFLKNLYDAFAQARITIQNKYYIRNLFYWLKSGACPMVEYVDADGNPIFEVE